MSYRLSKIYTRTGDIGTTNFGEHKRLAKTHPYIEAIGTLDELNSAIGVMLAQQPLLADIQKYFSEIQQDLFNLGGELCTPSFQVITADKITHLENIIDEWNETLPPLKEFIIPGGHLKTAFCHLARTICRRAERCIVALDEEKINPEILRYLNRLSDLLFVAARIITREAGDEEVMWKNSSL
jgi:cob(I)alamin adenosyltransferase